METDSLSTPRLFLRPFLAEDAPGLYAMSREETLRRFLPDQVYASPEEARETASFLRERVQSGAWPFVLGIVRRDTGELIGHVGISPVLEGMEIGYAVAMAHQGRGYAAEAVKAFSAWAVRRFSLPFLLGIVKADNPASIRVLEKAGYTLAEEGPRAAFGGAALCRRYLYTGEDIP